MLFWGNNVHILWAHCYKVNKVEENFASLPASLFTTMVQNLKKPLNIVIEIELQGLTEKFKEKDLTRTGSATLDYTTFILMVLPFISA
jgi:hypothetical protein